MSHVVKKFLRDVSEQQCSGILMSAEAIKVLRSDCKDPCTAASAALGIALAVYIAHVTSHVLRFELECMKPAHTACKHY
jgi:hypothetical protein